MYPSVLCESASLWMRFHRQGRCSSATIAALFFWVTTLIVASCAIARPLPGTPAAGNLELAPYRLYPRGNCCRKPVQPLSPQASGREAKPVTPAASSHAGGSAPRSTSSSGTYGGGDPRSGSASPPGSVTGSNGSPPGWGPPIHPAPKGPHADSHGGSARWSPGTNMSGVSNGHGFDSFDSSTSTHDESGGGSRGSSPRSPWHREGSSLSSGRLNWGGGGRGGGSPVLATSPAVPGALQRQGGRRQQQGDSPHSPILVGPTVPGHSRQPGPPGTHGSGPSSPK